MTVLAVAVVMLGLLSLFHLLLTIGVIRRLRVHTDALGRLSGSYGGAERRAAPPAVGRPVGDFAATTLDGEAVAIDALPAGTLVGFFLPDCPACGRNVTEFCRYARQLHGGRERAVAVVAQDSPNDGPEVARLVAQLSAAARVVVEPSGGPVASAFEVAVYPTFCLVGANHVVEASAFDVAGLRAASSGATAP